MSKTPRCLLGHPKDYKASTGIWIPKAHLFRVGLCQRLVPLGILNGTILTQFQRRSKQTPLHNKGNVDWISEALSDWNLPTSCVDSKLNVIQQWRARKQNPHVLQCVATCSLLCAPDSTKAQTTVATTCNHYLLNMGSRKGGWPANLEGCTYRNTIAAQESGHWNTQLHREAPCKQWQIPRREVLSQWCT